MYLKSIDLNPLNHAHKYIIYLFCYYLHHQETTLVTVHFIKIYKKESINKLQTIVINLEHTIGY